MIQTGKNFGYAGGNNRGIRHAIAQGAQWMLILNPDCRLEANALGIMVEGMRAETTAGIGGPRIREVAKGQCVYMDGSKVIGRWGYSQHEERFLDPLQSL